MENPLKKFTRNRLDKFFGPVGAFAGLILFIVGVGVSSYSYSGLILVIFGAFVGFSYSSVWIDFINRRVKFCNNIFGFIPLGKWIFIEDGMSVGLIKSNRVYRTYSRSNRVLDSLNPVIRLKLYAQDNREILDLQKFDSLENAKIELKQMSEKLKLPVNMRCYGVSKE